MADAEMRNGSNKANGGAGTLLSRTWNAPYVLLTLAGIFWAGNSIVGRAAAPLVPPVALAFWRWGLALLMILPFAWRPLKRDLPALAQHWRLVMALGMLGIGGFGTILYKALHYTTALNSLLMQAAQPPLILVFGVLLFGDRTRPREIVGLALAVLGVIVIVTRGDPHVLMGLRLNIGDAMMLGAVLCWTFYSVLLRKRPQVHPASFLAASMAAGLLLIAPLYVWELASGVHFHPNAAAFASILYVALFPSLIAYVLYSRSIDLVGSGAAGQFLNVMPVFGAGMSILFLGEQLKAYHLAGVALVGLGLLLSNGPSRKAA